MNNLSTNYIGNNEPGPMSLFPEDIEIFTGASPLEGIENEGERAVRFIERLRKQTCNDKIRIAIPTKDYQKSISNYMDILTELNAIPVVVGEECDPYVFDGLLLPGGVDIDPAIYGQKNVMSKNINNRLDSLQNMVMKRFIKVGKPVFGICRGLQLINVYFGGTLIQHIPNAEAHMKTYDKDSYHYCRSIGSSFIRELYGDCMVVNSAHHQAIGELGSGLEKVQVSDDGIVIEAIEHRSYPIYAVQWHPERLSEGRTVLAYFLSQCYKLKVRREGCCFSSRFY